jgi:hypothetical protein
MHDTLVSYLDNQVQVRSQDFFRERKGCEMVFWQEGGKHSDFNRQNSNGILILIVIVQP